MTAHLHSEKILGQPGKNIRAKMSTSMRPGRPVGGHGICGLMEVHMDNLFFALWKSPGHAPERPEDFWLDPPAPGFGRLLAAVAIIGVGVCFLDHAAAKGPADSLIASSYDSSR
ncbi:MULTISPECIES: hypothetical protein [unclassified Mesorhizobium]|uniref:hypothetical protein n=1 Tax=unclassified Mesorhizobium TaxID=325217 RepID=UPI001FDEF61B|nr:MULTISPECIES: hypothetical protein [unclassified Mesorhizobium]